MLNLTIPPPCCKRGLFSSCKDKNKRNPKRLKIYETRLPMVIQRKKVFFWNNRNARRKQKWNFIWWFKEGGRQVGHDNATYLMHTDARDHTVRLTPHNSNTWMKWDKVKLINEQSCLWRSGIVLPSC